MGPGGAGTKNSGKGGSDIQTLDGQGEDQTEGKTSSEQMGRTGELIRPR